MSVTRRRVLAAAVAAAALGAGTFVWRAQRFEHDTAGLWRLRLPQTQGGELDFAALLGRPLLLNFWATWCPPCVHEMPQLDRFATEFAARGGVVVGLAADQTGAVRDFLKRAPVRYPIALAGFEGIALARRLGNADGGLPFTVLFGRDGRIAQRKLGPTTHAELAGWVAG